MLTYFKNVFDLSHLLLKLPKTLHEEDTIVKPKKHLSTKLQKFQNKTWKDFFKNGNVIPCMKLHGEKHCF
jgi:hypothetical protein